MPYLIYTVETFLAEFKLARNMEKSSLNFIDIKNNPLQEIYQNRLIDWHENGENIIRLYEKHEEEYRKKICVNCDDVQKEKRGCYRSKELDSNGNLKTSCEHMSKAGCKKLKEIRLKHINFHPMFFNSE